LVSITDFELWKRSLDLIAVVPSGALENCAMASFREWWTTPRRFAFSTFWVAVGLLACRSGPVVESDGGEVQQGAEGVPLFVEMAAEVGLEFDHINGMSGELFLAEITCGGGGLLDYDADGDLDIYLPQGHLLKKGGSLADAFSPQSIQPPPGDRLFRNDLSWGPDGLPVLRFSDVSRNLPPSKGGYGCGVAVGDYDRDGFPDIYVTSLGPNRLLRNLGDGSFHDVTARAGVGDDGSGVTATFFDYDGDGWLDLFLGKNVTFDLSGATGCFSLSGAPDYCGPGAYRAEADRLFHNRGSGVEGHITFEDVTAATGLAASPQRPTLGVVAADFNGDGWSDLYVANDGQPNTLWINGRGVRFTDEALLSGSALSADGAAEASMGVDTADVDGDGDLDLFLTHLVKESNTFYRNSGQGSFTDVTAAYGLAAPSLPFTSFGSGFLDFDNDGLLDLMVVNGGVTLVPELVAKGDPFPLHQTNQLFQNGGASGSALIRFIDVSARSGPAFLLSEVSRGLALGDIDNDGDTDALVINSGGPVRLLINQVGRENPWLGLRLVTGDPPRDAVGARAAIVRDGNPVVWRRVASDGSYGSAGDVRLLFGLGQKSAIDEIWVLWPGGLEESWPAVPVGRYTILAQGTGRSLVSGQ
jgi:hypothetical protein